MQSSGGGEVGDGSGSSPLRDSRSATLWYGDEVMAAVAAAAILCQATTVYLTVPHEECVWHKAEFNVSFSEPVGSAKNIPLEPVLMNSGTVYTPGRNFTLRQSFIRVPLCRGREIGRN